MAYWNTSIVQSVINEPYIFDKLVLYVYTQSKSNTIILTGNGPGNNNITI